MSYQSSNAKQYGEQRGFFLLPSIIYGRILRGAFLTLIGLGGLSTQSDLIHANPLNCSRNSSSKLWLSSARKCYFLYVTKAHKPSYSSTHAPLNPLISLICLLYTRKQVNGGSSSRNYQLTSNTFPQVTHGWVNSVLELLCITELKRLEKKVMPP